MRRKSTASAAVATTDTNGDISMASEPPTTSPPKQSNKKKDAQPQEKPQGQQGDVVALDDLLLPRSIIQRLAKGVLPPNTSIQRDAILALTKSATVFISLLASTANEMTERKTIQSGDVVKALREIELEGVMQLKDGTRGGRVEREVEVWEREVRGKRRGYRERLKARESGGAAGEEDRSKRQRVEGEAGRDGSVGPITDTTGKLELDVDVSGARGKPDDLDGVEEEGEQGGEEEADEESEEEEQFEDAEEEPEEQTKLVEDSIDVDEDATRRRKNDTLAPDGRVEVGGSDDESD